MDRAGHSSQAVNSLGLWNLVPSYVANTKLVRQSQFPAEDITVAHHSPVG